MCRNHNRKINLNTHVQRRHLIVVYLYNGFPFLIDVLFKGERFTLPAPAIRVTFRKIWYRCSFHIRNTFSISKRRLLINGGSTLM